MDKNKVFDDIERIYKSFAALIGNNLCASGMKSLERESIAKYGDIIKFHTQIIGTMIRLDLFEEQITSETPADDLFVIKLFLERNMEGYGENGYKVEQ